MENRIWTKHIWLWMLLLCIPFSLVGCDGDVHEDEEGGLSVALAWQEASDAVDTKDIRLWIFDANGSLVKSLTYTDLRQLASERYSLSAGTYKVVTAVNLTSPFVASDALDFDDLLFSLSEASASPRHAFYGVAEAAVGGDKAVTVVTDTIRRMMSELTITITDAPASSVLTGTVNNAATGFYPGGAQTTDDLTTVTLPATTAQGTTLQTQTLRLMPTADGQSKTKLSLQVTDANGHVSDFAIEAPVMKAGGKYSVTLEYPNMRAFMNLSTWAINSWTEGWTYDEEIINPGQ